MGWQPLKVELYVLLLRGPEKTFSLLSLVYYSSSSYYYYYYYYYWYIHICDTDVSLGLSLLWLRTFPASGSFMCCSVDLQVATTSTTNSTSVSNVTTAAPHLGSYVQDEQHCHVMCVSRWVQSCQCYFARALWCWTLSLLVPFSLMCIHISRLPPPLSQTQQTARATHLRCRAFGRYELMEVRVSDVWVRFHTVAMHGRHFVDFLVV